MISATWRRLTTDKITCASTARCTYLATRRSRFSACWRSASVASMCLKVTVIRMLPSPEPSPPRSGELPALGRRQDAHQLPILGDRAPRNVDVLLGEAL